ncbi:MAG: Nitroreductase [uncultured Chloroflexia bacterium]|uniref:Nitroreductase n=1 Tax=uncultured Chloroflexia bacterium TaxID=1672391 RepID=A0A6J4JCN2_9CHLR|nr:MAG: Nitroreductase [uncultured Chloroflexia bacterium]
MAQHVDLYEMIRTRRTTNGAFKPDPVAPEHVRTLLEMASHAPSHFNSQPWRFIVVQDQQRRTAVAEIAGQSMRMLMEEGSFWKRYSKYFRFSKDDVERTADGIHFDNMPSVLKPFARYVFSPKGGAVINKFQVPRVLGHDAHKLVASSPLLLGITLARSEYQPEDLSGLYSVISLGAVIQTIWLTANSLGMGMQFISTPMEVEGQWEKIVALLEVPDDQALLVLFRLGYVDPDAKRPTIDWSSPQRKRLGELAFSERWGASLEPVSHPDEVLPQA